MIKWTNQALRAGGRSAVGDAARASAGRRARTTAGRVPSMGTGATNRVRAGLSPDAALPAHVRNRQPSMGGGRTNRLRAGLAPDAALNKNLSRNVAGWSTRRKLGVGAAGAGAAVFMGSRRTSGPGATGRSSMYGPPGLQGQFY